MPENLFYRFSCRATPARRNELSSMKVGFSFAKQFSNLYAIFSTFNYIKALNTGQRLVLNSMRNLPSHCHKSRQRAIPKCISGMACSTE